LYIGNIFVAVLFCICVASCSEEYSSPLKGQTVSNQIFETGTTTKTITIGKGDLSKCTIVSNADWCSASIQGSSVTISVKANDTYDERQATITLTDPEDETILSFIVMQKQKDAIIVEKSTYDVPEEGGIVTVKIDSNVDYEVELPKEGWITILNGTRGLKNSELSLNVALNDSGNRREGIVKIVNKKSGINEKVIIKQALTPKITIDHENISVNEDGDEVTIKVQSNVNVNVATNEDWISIGEKKDINGFNFSVTIRVLPMSSGYTRSGLVAFESSEGRIMALVYVYQEADEVLSVNKTTISAVYTKGEQYITVTANTEFSISTPSWIKMSLITKTQYKDSDCYDYLYKVTIEMNSSQNERNDNIVFKSKSKEAIVFVNQEGRPDIGDQNRQAIIGRWAEVIGSGADRYWQFKENNIFRESYYDKISAIDYVGYYKIEGSYLYLHYDYMPEGVWKTFTILRLTESNLELTEIKDNGGYVRRSFIRSHM